MHLVRRADSVPYQPTDHAGVSPFRVQGREAGGPASMAISISHYPPGSGSDHLVPSPAELVYLVVEGTIEVEHSEGVELLEQYDSISFSAGEPRAARNNTHLPAVLVVIHQEFPAEM